MEAFKTFDREGQGLVSAAEVRHVLSGYGERLDDPEIEEIIKVTKLHIDLEGNVKYEGQSLFPFFDIFNSIGCSARFFYRLHRIMAMSMFY